MAQHHINCAWHLDQYAFECNCGVTRPNTMPYQNQTIPLSPERVGEADGWREIETAPKDGRAILGFDRDLGLMAVIEWRREYENWGLRCFGVHTDSEDAVWDPSDWMPLPAPPKQKSPAQKDEA